VVLAAPKAAAANDLEMTKIAFKGVMKKIWWSAVKRRYLRGPE